MVELRNDDALRWPGGQNCHREHSLQDMVSIRTAPGFIVLQNEGLQVLMELVSWMPGLDEDEDPKVRMDIQQEHAFCTSHTHRTKGLAPDVSPRMSKNTPCHAFASPPEVMEDTGGRDTQILV